MTAARSDLMALKNEADRIVKCGVTDFPVYQAIELLEEVSGTIDHLAAASQPDREAVKEFIASASFASRSSLDSDTIFCEIYTPGYSPAKKGSFGFFVKELRAILSLLSGAGTKSDGVEGHADPQGSGPDVKPAPIADSSEAGRGERVLPGETRIYEAGKGGMPHAALSAPVGEPVAYRYRYNGQWYLSQGKSFALNGFDLQPLYTHPPAPAVGADVGRRVLDILNAVAPAVENLAGHQEQCDMDGVMVKVSRQALDEVLNAVNEVALVSALTRPRVAAKQESCPESATRTETAVRDWRKSVFTYEHNDVAGHLYYFAPQVTAPGPFLEQRHVQAIVDIASDGTFAGVELIDNMPPLSSGGADTKSDGGVVADTPSDETATEVMAHPSPMGSRSCDEKTIACGVAGVAPGPSDQLTKTPSADHDAGNLRGLAEPNHQPHAVSQGWQPIETAPKDGTPFIGAFWSIRWADSHRRGDIVRCWYQPEFEAFISSCREMTLARGYTFESGATRELHSPVIEPVTHWMPLPAPPSPAKTGGVEG